MPLLSKDNLPSMASSQPKARTIGAAQFDPDEFFKAWATRPPTLSESEDLRSLIITAFDLPHNDSYVYHAIASVTLAQVQQAIRHGGEAGLHAWYLDEEGKPVISSRRYRAFGIA